MITNEYFKSRTAVFQFGRYAQTAGFIQLYFFIFLYMLLNFLKSV